MQNSIIYNKFYFQTEGKDTELIYNPEEMTEENPILNFFKNEVIQNLELYKGKIYRFFNVNQFPDWVIFSLIENMEKKDNANHVIPKADLLWIKKDFWLKMNYSLELLFNVLLKLSQKQIKNNFLKIFINLINLEMKIQKNTEIEPQIQKTLIFLFDSIINDQKVIIHQPPSNILKHLSLLPRSFLLNKTIFQTEMIHDKEMYFKSDILVLPSVDQSEVNNKSKENNQEVYKTYSLEDLLKFKNAKSYEIHPFGEDQVKRRNKIKKNKGIFLGDIFIHYGSIGKTAFLNYFFNPPEMPVTSEAPESFSKVFEKYTLINRVYTEISEKHNNQDPEQNYLLQKKVLQFPFDPLKTENIQEINSTIQEIYDKIREYTAEGHQILRNIQEKQLNYNNLCLNRKTQKQDNSNTEKKMDRIQSRIKQFAKEIEEKLQLQENIKNSSEEFSKSKDEIEIEHKLMDLEQDFISKKQKISSDKLKLAKITAEREKFHLEVKNSLPGIIEREFQQDFEFSLKKLQNYSADNKKSKEQLQVLASKEVLIEIEKKINSDKVSLEKIQFKFLDGYSNQKREYEFTTFLWVLMDENWINILSKQDLNCFDIRTLVQIQSLIKIKNKILKTDIFRITAKEKIDFFKDYFTKYQFIEDSLKKSEEIFTQFNCGLDSYKIKNAFHSYEYFNSLADLVKYLKYLSHNKYFRFNAIENVIDKFEHTIENLQKYSDVEIRITENSNLKFIEECSEKFQEIFKIHNNIILLHNLIGITKSASIKPEMMVDYIQKRTDKYLKKIFKQDIFQQFESNSKELQENYEKQAIMITKHNINEDQLVKLEFNFYIEELQLYIEMLEKLIDKYDKIDLDFDDIFVEYPIILAQFENLRQQFKDHVSMIKNRSENCGNFSDLYAELKKEAKFLSSSSITSNSSSNLRLTLESLTQKKFSLKSQIIQSTLLENRIKQEISDLDQLSTDNGISSTSHEDMFNKESIEPSTIIEFHRSKTQIIHQMEDLIDQMGYIEGVKENNDMRIKNLEDEITELRKTKEVFSISLNANDNKLKKGKNTFNQYESEIKAILSKDPEINYEMEYTEDMFYSNSLFTKKLNLQDIIDLISEFLANESNIESEIEKYVKMFINFNAQSSHELFFDLLKYLIWYYNEFSNFGIYSQSTSYDMLAKETLRFFTYIMKKDGKIFKNLPEIVM